MGNIREDRIISYITLLIICIITSQQWKVAKWCEIRYKTRHLDGSSSIKRFHSYMKNRGRVDVEEMTIAETAS